MFAVIHIVSSSYQALLRTSPQHRYQPVAVLDEAERITTSKKNQGKSRILQLSIEAAEMGVRIGMTATQGQARCECLILLNRDLDAETKLAQDLCDVAERFTPDFELTTDGVVTLDLRGVPGIENPAIGRKLGRQMIESLDAIDLDAQVGFAPNPDLAFLAGKCGEPINILKNAGSLHSHLLAVLEIEPKLAEILDTWGIRTLGDLVDLPRAALVDRLGETAGELWDRAAGKRHRLLKLERPVPVFEGKTDFDDHEVKSLEPVLFALQCVLEKITARLAAGYLVAEQIWLRLTFSDGTEYQRRFRIPEPSGDAALLLSIIHTHLDGFIAKAPIVELYARAIPSRGGKHQFDLFSSGVKDPNRLAETLARLEAILGPERIGEPAPLPTHQPDSFEVKPFDAAKEPEILTEETALNGLVLRRFRPRVHVEVELGEVSQKSVIVDATRFFRKNDQTLFDRRSDPVRSKNDERPCYIKGGPVKGRVVECLGPWRFSGNWWEKAETWRREEWDVALESGGIFRLARDQGEWFLEAAYG